MGQGRESMEKSTKRRNEKAKLDPVIMQKRRNYKNKYMARPEVKKRRNEMYLELKEIAKELGHCCICLKPKVLGKYVTCISCRQKRRILYYKNKEKKQKLKLAKEVIAKHTHDISCSPTEITRKDAILIWDEAADIDWDKTLGEESK